jgi:FMN-dependent NADH-azoreductase
MPHLLYVKASPRGAASRSIAIADAYLAILREKYPSMTVDELDLWAAGLPEFDGDWAKAKMNMVTGARNTGKSAILWDEIAKISGRFTNASRYLFAVPMWNGGIPYKLKQLIDIIHQPGLTFGLNRESGYYGLLANRKATIVYTSGAYSPDAASPAFGTDHHSTYLRAWLFQTGIIDVEEIRFQPTVLAPEPEAAFEHALAKARELAVKRR